MLVKALITNRFETQKNRNFSSIPTKQTQNIFHLFYLSLIFLPSMLLYSVA